MRVINEQIVLSCFKLSLNEVTVPVFFKVTADHFIFGFASPRYYERIVTFFMLVVSSDHQLVALVERK